MSEEMSDDMSEEMTEEGGHSGAAAVDIDAMLAVDLDNCEAAPTGEPIRVGMAMDFSEVVGFVDIPGSKLVPYVADLINCMGGVNGAPVEVRVEDVGGDATTAGVAAETLLDWGAQFLIGPPFADFALPILQATGGEVPLFVAASTEPTLADDRPELVPRHLRRQRAGHGRCRMGARPGHHPGVRAHAAGSVHRPQP